MGTDRREQLGGEGWQGAATPAHWDLRWLLGDVVLGSRASARC
jgi:hypothetical protein